MSPRRIPCFTSVFLFLLTGALFLTSCSSDDATAPDDTDQTLASDTIGADGGALGTDDFALTVPAGAFGDSADLVLTAGQAPEFDDYGAATDVFLLSGLPAAWTDSLTIGVGYSGDLSEQNFVAVGTPETTTGSRDVMYHYEYYEAVDQDGLLVAKIPGTEAEALGLDRAAAGERSEAEDAIRILGLTGMRHRRYPGGEDSDFWITYYQTFDPLVDAIFAFFDFAAGTWQAQGFDFSHAVLSRSSVLPVKIAIEPESGGAGLSNEPGEYWIKYTYYMDGYSDGPSRARLFSHACTSPGLPDLGLFICREFFHLVHFRSNPWSIGHAAWMRIAVGDWGERLFVSEPDHTPDAFTAHQTEVLAGLQQKDDTTDPGAYGHAFSAVLTYLTDTYGTPVLPAAYAGMREQDEAAEALLEAVPDDPSIWWPEFVEALLAGEVYDVDTDAFVESAVQTLSITSGGSSETVWTEDFHDLSAQVFRVDLAYDDLNPGASLRIQAGGDEVDASDLSVAVYSLDAGALTHLTTGVDVTILDLDQLQASGVDLVAVVSCADTYGDNDTTRPITVAVNVSDEETPHFNAASFHVTYEAHMADGTTRPQQGLNGLAYGSFTGTTFSASWDSVGSGVHYTGTLTATYDPANQRLLSWAFDSTWNYGGGTMNEYWATGGAADLAYESATYERFDIPSDALCAHLTDIGFRATQEGVVAHEVTGWACNENSYAEVYLRLEDN